MNHSESKNILNEYLIKEFRDLTLMIVRMREAISTLQHQCDDRFCFTDTPDVLESVIVATASATNTILDSIEILETLKPFFKNANQETLIKLVTRMYEVCTFQDISGQRLTKVIRTLRRIEVELKHFFDVYAHYINYDNGDDDNHIGLSDELNRDLLVDLQKINAIIQLNKREMSKIQYDMQPSFQFNGTHDELGAVIQSTNEANRILRECIHNIQNLDGHLTIDNEQTLKHHIITIYEVCMFQDIISQCIENVINTLTAIDGTLGRIFNDYGICDRIDHRALKVLSADSLMNGPQLPKDAHTQDVIDTIFTTATSFEK